MPNDREQRLLALIRAQQSPVVEPTRADIIVAAKVFEPNEPDANGDVYSEDALQNIMMDAARRSIGADMDGIVTMAIPADSPEAYAIQAGVPMNVSLPSYVSLPTTDTVNVAPEEAVPLLSDLFMMHQEAQDAIDAGVAFTEPSRTSGDDTPIEFDTDGELDGVTAPNERVRFQVGRESPPPTSFSRETHAGPSEGRVVSRRGDDGQFQVVPRPSVTLSLAQHPVEIRGLTPPIPAPPAPPAPTRWERISGPDPFDD